MEDISDIEHTHFKYKAHWFFHIHTCTSMLLSPRPRHGLFPQPEGSLVHPNSCAPKDNYQPDCYRHRLALPVFELHEWITQHALFCLWLLSLNIMSVRFIHVVAVFKLSLKNSIYKNTFYKFLLHLKAHIYLEFGSCNNKLMNGA